MLQLLLLACTGPSSSPAPDSEVLPGDTQDSVDWGALNGELIDPPLPLPEFSGVLDSTGAQVSPDALVGHPTVLWFYPKAESFG